MQSVLDMAGGSIRRRVDAAIDEAIENCLDWSTDAGKDRKVILTIKLRPDKGRTVVGISADVNTKLVPDAPTETSLSVMDVNGALTIAENTPDIPGQMGFGEEPIISIAAE